MILVLVPKITFLTCFGNFWPLFFLRNLICCLNCKRELSKTMFCYFFWNLKMPYFESKVENTPIIHIFVVLNLWDLWASAQLATGTWHFDSAKLVTWGDSHWGVVHLQTSSMLPGWHSRAGCSHKHGENKTWILSLFFLNILSHMYVWGFIQRQ